MFRTFSGTNIPGGPKVTGEMTSEVGDSQGPKVTPSKNGKITKFDYFLRAKFNKIAIPILAYKYVSYLQWNKHPNGPKGDPSKTVKVIAFDPLFFKKWPIFLKHRGGQHCRGKLFNR